MRRSICFHVKPEGAAYLRARKAPIAQESRLTVLLRVIRRLRRAKFLTAYLVQMQHPVGVSRQTFLDQAAFQALLSQVQTHTRRALASCRVIGHEVLHVPLVIDKFFGAKRLDQRRDNVAIVTFFQQFSA